MYNVHAVPRPDWCLLWIVQCFPLNRTWPFFFPTLDCRQEIDRVQRVINTVYTNLCDLKLAIDGTIVMSHYLRQSLDAMYDARIPEKWQKVKLLVGEVRARRLAGSFSYCWLRLSAVCLAILNSLRQWEDNRSTHCLQKRYLCCNERKLCHLLFYSNYLSLTCRQQGKKIQWIA